LSFFFGFASGGVQAVVPKRYGANLILLRRTCMIVLFNTGITCKNIDDYISKVWVFSIPHLGGYCQNPTVIYTFDRYLAVDYPSYWQYSLVQSYRLVIIREG
jgi:hypothetical protein